MFNNIIRKAAGAASLVVLTGTVLFGGVANPRPANALSVAVQDLSAFAQSNSNNVYVFLCHNYNGGTNKLVVRTRTTGTMTIHNPQVTRNADGSVTATGQILFRGQPLSITVTAAQTPGTDTGRVGFALDTPSGRLNAGAAMGVVWIQ